MGGHGQFIKGRSIDELLEEFEELRLGNVQFIKSLDLGEKSNEKEGKSPSAWFSKYLRIHSYMVSA